MFQSEIKVLKGMLEHWVSLEYFIRRLRKKILNSSHAHLSAKKITFLIKVKIHIDSQNIFQKLNCQI